MKQLFTLLFTILCIGIQAQTVTDTLTTLPPIVEKKQPVKDWFKNVPFWFSSTDSNQLKGIVKKWFENIHIRGYMQFRYNRLAETNKDLKCEQCDRSWGDGGGFFFRRVRVIIFGQLTKRIYFYIQPDFGSSASTTGLHFGQLRDAYVDLGIDRRSEFRFRIGQSKVPFGFENLQSSQNRLPLDRNDALNSALSNERDLGIFFYWAPQKIRERFSMLVNEGYKGSGDYGVFAVGLYNGQTANKPELNKDKHVVARLTYPFKIKSQIFEPSIQAYTGKYEMPDDLLSSGVKVRADKTYLDQRIAASFVLYPRPFGITAEFNMGRGPQFNKQTDSIELRKLIGGYVTLNYMIKAKGHTIFPFVRGQYYDGGKKHEKDARSYLVKEVEFGVEWQPVRFCEIVVVYTLSSRRFEDFAKQDNLQSGRLLRIQAQVNF
jgi:hypothetical protein